MSRLHQAGIRAKARVTSAWSPVTRRRSVGSNATLALIGDLATKVGMFVTLVVAAHILSTVEFARLGIALAAVTILAAFFDLMYKKCGQLRPASRQAALAQQYGR